MNLRKRTGVVLAAVLLAAASGCSTKAPGGGGGGGGGGAGGGGDEIQTGQGVDGNTITLGVLTDLTGVFAALGNDITNAHTMYWEKKNQEGGGVCGKYQVKLNVKDTGYVPQQGVQLYSGMRADILAMQQTIGSPINTALEKQYRADNVVNIPSAWARNLAGPPGNIVPGATYDIESINILGHALEAGLIKEGDTIGHIYFTGEYGENGLAGSEYMAEKHNLKIVPAEIKATDQDMSAQVTQFKAQGVKAIMLTTAPTQTASVATVSETQGLRVPILGNNPIFAPGLLKGPAGKILIERARFAAPSSTFKAQPALLEEYKTRFKVQEPSLGVIVGYSMSDIMAQVIEKACDNGDLTQEGMIEAKQALSNVAPTTAEGPLLVPLNLAVAEGESPSKQSFILKPANVPGGVERVVQAPYQGADVEEFKPAT